MRALLSQKVVKTSFECTGKGIGQQTQVGEPTVVTVLALTHTPPRVLASDLGGVGCWGVGSIWAFSVTCGQDPAGPALSRQHCLEPYGLAHHTSWLAFRELLGAVKLRWISQILFP